MPFIVLAAFALAIARYLYLRSYRARPRTDAPPIYTASVLVRDKTWLRQWSDWHARYGGGPELIVRPSSFEVVAPQGMVLASRDVVIESSTAVMWFDSVGWAGTPFGRRECIHVSGKNRKGWGIELALTPEDGLQRAWNALLESGVSPTGPIERPAIRLGPRRIPWRWVIAAVQAVVMLSFVTWMVVRGVLGQSSP